MADRTVALVADHAGFELKNSLKDLLDEHGFVLALGARLIEPEVARDCLLTFLSAPFAGGRHARPVAKLSSVP